MYGEATDPTPYIAAAYAIGFIFIFGYGLWLVLNRKTTLRMMDALNKDKYGS